MIISPSKADSEHQRLLGDDEDSFPLEGPPPTFSEAVASGSRLVVQPQQEGSQTNTNTDECPPPEFTPYTAEHTGGDSADVISHDPHLNEDGEALYRFLLSKAFQKPEITFHFRGTHTEGRTRQVVSHVNGKTTTRTEYYTETIVDYDFWIDASSAILSEEDDSPVIWTVGDLAPAYRGKVYREVDNTPFLPNDIEVGDVRTALVHHPTSTIAKWIHRRRKASRAERKEADSWDDRRRSWGYPPWVRIRGQRIGTEAGVESAEMRSHLAGILDPAAAGWYGDDDVLVPSKTLREWADEYCASNKILKEFTFQKVLYGWNMESLLSALKFTAQSSSNSTSQTVDMVINGSQVIVRPDSGLSRALSKLWVCILLWVTLIYPLFIWPFKRFHSRGGGEWRVCGSAFALARWKHLEGSIPGETVEEYLARTPATPITEDLIPLGSEKMTRVDNPARRSAGSSNHPLLESIPQKKPPVLKATERGISRLVGNREGEWFREWEDTISSLVARRYQSPEPIRYPGGRGRRQFLGFQLEGYQ